jgi:hypothetical protein
MTRDEMLHVIAMEECDELSQRLSKALRFGGDEIQPGQPNTNRQRVLMEFADLLAAMEMLGFMVGPGALGTLRGLVDAKKAKVERYLAYSEQCGTLTPEPGEKA